MSMPYKSSTYSLDIKFHSFSNVLFMVFLSRACRLLKAYQLLILPRSARRTFKYTYLCACMPDLCTNQPSFHSTDLLYHCLLRTIYNKTANYLQQNIQNPEWTMYSKLSRIYTTFYVTLWQHLQRTSVNAKQPLTLRERCLGHVCKLGKASHNACIDAGFKRTHPLTLRESRPHCGETSFFRRRPSCELECRVLNVLVVIVHSGLKEPAPVRHNTIVTEV